MKRTSLGLCCGAVLLLVACGGGDGGGNSPDSGTSSPDAGPTTITVNGKVMDSRGNPVANAAVLILGMKTVTSDASGAFSVAGVVTPYDIAAVNGGKQSAVVYKGVTRQNPTLSLSNDAASSPAPFSATVVGSVTGAVKPSTTVANPELKFVSPETSSAEVTYNASASTYSANVSWSGAATTTGTLFAFQGERTSATAAYTKFTGFGRRDNVSLSNGATVSNQSVALNSVANSTLAGTVTVPGGLSLVVNSVSLQLEPSVQVPLFNNVYPAASFSYAVPVVAQSTLRFTSVASSADGKSVSFGIKTGVAAGTNNVSLAIKPPSSPILPLDNATQVTRSTEFSWSATAGGVHILAFSKSSGGTPYTLTVVTSASQTTVPDLSALGMGLPANASLLWQVQGISPIGSVDIMLAGTDPAGVPTGLNEFYFAASGSRTLTVASAP